MHPEMELVLRMGVSRLPNLDWLSMYATKCLCQPADPEIPYLDQCASDEECLNALPPKGDWEGWVWLQWFARHSATLHQFILRAKRRAALRELKSFRTPSRHHLQPVRAARVAGGGDRTCTCFMFGTLQHDVTRHAVLPEHPVLAGVLERQVAAGGD